MGQKRSKRGKRRNKDKNPTPKKLWSVARKRKRRADEKIELKNTDNETQTSTDYGSEECQEEEGD